MPKNFIILAPVLKVKPVLAKLDLANQWECQTSNTKNTVNITAKKR
jgi:hypothetical protein